MKVIIRLIALLAFFVALIQVTSCSGDRPPSFTEVEGYTRADTVISDIGDMRDFPRLIAITDSFERNGEISPIRAIFYTTIAYNLMGQHRTALSLYYKMANINPQDFNCQADLESYVYAYKDYVRLLCDMRRYDRALREAYHAELRLKEAGYEDFAVHQDIAQMMGECQLYLDQDAQATESFRMSQQAMHERLAKHHDPLDLLECQKTMNAIARAYIHTGRHNWAEPWIERQDSLLAVAVSHPRRDSVFVDEMKSEICYTKALLAQSQGRIDDAERAFSEYQSTRKAKNLGGVIQSCEYLMLTHRYDEAARNYTLLDCYLKESGYKVDLENIGRYMIPKYKANLLAGNRDSALLIATKVADYFDTALVRQKISDADLLSTVYDTEGKERQIAEQRAELWKERLIAVAVVLVLILFFFHLYLIQRRKSFDELNATNRELMLANERAEESSRMKTKFIHQISHEVRTPLNVLSGFTQVLARPDIELTKEEIQSFSKKIIENSERITHLVDKMLDLSMINADANIDCSDTVAPEDLATQAVQTSGICRVDHLDFHLQLSPEVQSMSLLTNEKSAVKALALLLDNAMKFTHPLAFRGRKVGHGKARVDLSVSATQHLILFAVEDTGIGVPADQAENIFTEFVQLDEYSEGTGIGLSIARSLARHMNGDIILDTAYMMGARFVMSLPL